MNQSELKTGAYYRVVDGARSSFRRGDLVQYTGNRNGFLYRFLKIETNCEQWLTIEQFEPCLHAVDQKFVWGGGYVAQ